MADSCDGVRLAGARLAKDEHIAATVDPAIACRKGQYVRFAASGSSVEVERDNHLDTSECPDQLDGYWYLKPGYYAEGPTGYWPVDGGWMRLCGWAEMVEPMGKE